jgi:hypothetical protein
MLRHFVIFERTVILQLLGAKAIKRVDGPPAARRRHASFLTTARRVQDYFRSLS